MYIIWVDLSFYTSFNGYPDTVLPAKSDSDVMFCLQSYQGRIIDRSLDMINTQVMYRFALAQVNCTR